MTDFNGVSFERQVGLFRKYGVAENLIKIIEGKDDDEERRKTLAAIVVGLNNKMWAREIHPDDFEDVSAMLPEEYRVTKDLYQLFWDAKEMGE